MNSPTERSNQIQAIINRRQPLARQIESVKQQLNILCAALDFVSQRRDELLTQIHDETIQKRLLGIDFETLRDQASAERNVLARFEARFGRTTLNIGVVGLARQGKSQLLRSLTGLSDETIPAGRFGHCTGTRSTIYHQPGVKPHGEIHLYTEPEFIETVLGAYYGEPLGLYPQPYSLDDFEDSVLPALPANKRDSLSARLKYEHLKLYQDGLPEYRSLLSEPSPIKIPISQIREYIAYDDPTGQRIYKNFLAVREARIVCTFPYDNLGQIALVDMPGLGDTGLGSEQRLLQTLGHEVDAVLFVKKPSGLGAVWDKQEIELYDLARAAMPELPLELWAFLVMNHVRSSSPNEDNMENCQRLLAEKSENMKFADAVIADCSNADDANQIVLQKVLDYLAQNIDNIDRLYVGASIERLQSLQTRLDAEVSKARDVLGRDTDPIQSEFNLFIQLFEETERRLASGLELRMKELLEKRNEPNEAFHLRVVQAKERCRQDPGIPTLEEIEETANIYKSYQIACHYHLNFVRTHLVHHFESLDDGLVSSLNEVKDQIGEVLRSESRGRLMNLSPHTGAAFLRDIALQMEDYPRVLYPAFTMYANFQISFQGFLYYRLRKHLDCLTPNGGQAQIGSSPTAQDVRDILVAMQRIVLDSLKNEFQEWPVEMNQAAFAVTEDFVDRVLRSKEAHTEWQSFYMDNRNQIWQEKFEQLTNTNRVRRLWLEAIERVVVANQPLSLPTLDSSRTKTLRNIRRSR